jgi:hypothetical protein
VALRGSLENRIAHAPAFAQTPSVQTCVLSDAFSVYE